MKIRIGLGTGGASATPEGLAEVVTALDEPGFNSLCSPRLPPARARSACGPGVGRRQQSAPEARDHDAFARAQRAPAGQAARDPGSPVWGRLLVTLLPPHLRAGARGDRPG